MDQLAADAPPPLRRFTIFDGLLLTIVMAGASLAARVNLPATIEVCRVIRPVHLADPAYWADPTVTNPYLRSQLRSTNLLMMATVQGTAGLQSPLVWVHVPKQGQALVAIRQCVVLVFPILAYLSYGLLLLRLVRPRPGWGALLGQPGCSACLAAALALPVITWTEQITIETISVGYVSAAVGATWVVQTLGRRWRPEPSWIDQTGRVLGGCWLMVGLIATL